MTLRYDLLVYDNQSTNQQYNVLNTAVPSSSLLYSTILYILYQAHIGVRPDLAKEELVGARRQTPFPGAYGSATAGLAVDLTKNRPPSLCANP